MELEYYNKHCTFSESIDEALNRNNAQFTSLCEEYNTDADIKQPDISENRWSIPHNHFIICNHWRNPKECHERNSAVISTIDITFIPK